MIKFRCIEIQNFVCFDRLVIEPSTDEGKPLTVIRAENGAGKTTLLRALRWGMYGDRGLPGDDPTRFPLHPAWWDPNDSGVKTRVAVEFETDGSHRDDTTGRTTPTVYQLARSVITIYKSTEREDEPDFHRINEHTQLLKKKVDGIWTPYTAGVRSVVNQLLPWELCDFFFVDADEAADFVGGSENKQISRIDVIKKTTAAVHGLLGIDVFKDAAERVAKIAREFDVQATNAIGDTDLNALQSELSQLIDNREKLEKDIKHQYQQKTELEDCLAKLRRNCDQELKNMGSADQLRKRQVDNQQSMQEASKQKSKTINLLAAGLESAELLASLASSKVTYTYEMLHPLYEQGHIPLKYLNFVRDLLNSQTCVCGQDLTEGSTPRQLVKERIEMSSKEENRANYLGQLYDAAKSLVYHTDSQLWDDREILEVDLSNIEKRLQDLRLDKKDIDDDLDALDNDKIEVIRDEIETFEVQLDKYRRNIANDEAEKLSMKSPIDSLQKRINERQRRESATKEKRDARDLGKLISRIIEQAYSSIQSKQVRELSTRMNRLFALMAANVSADDFEEIQRNSASVRMIAEVGIRPVAHNPDDYEIYALNRRHRSMQPTEINGASRRVLALSFVLALCIESKTLAPLIADSLLNFMSGRVRRNTLRTIAENSKQPILLLTGSDLAESSEIETVSKYAGVTYTLTGQWDALDAGQGGDVVNWTDQRQVSVMCLCGPRQYCEICERAGQAGTPGWTKRT